MPATWYPRLPPFGMPLRSAAFKRLYEEAILEALGVLDGASRIYWVAEGTLIALLRFGRNGHPRRGRVVDEDIDVMIEVSGQDEWVDVAAGLRDRLRTVGWYGAEMLSTAPEIGGRLDLLRCWRRGHGALTRLDVHSYWVDVAAATATVHGAPSAFPFQTWGGAMPIGLIHPLRSVRCYTRAAPCPNRPTEVLRGWNDGEYGVTVAVPARGASPVEVRRLCDYARMLEADGYCSMRLELISTALWQDETSAPNANG
jgi:hypothetical protein